VIAIAKRAETHLGDNFVVRSEAIGAIATYSPPARGERLRKFGDLDENHADAPAKGWHLVRVERVAVHPRQAKRFAVTPNDHAAAAAVKRLLKTSAAPRCRTSSTRRSTNIDPTPGAERLPGLRA